MMLCVPHPLLCAAHVLHNVKNPGRFADFSSMIEQLDSHLWIRSVRVKTRHAALARFRKLLAGRGSNDEVEFFQPRKTEAEFQSSANLKHVHLNEVGVWKMLADCWMVAYVHAHALPSPRSKGPRPSPASAEQVQKPHPILLSLLVSRTLAPSTMISSSGLDSS